MAALRRSQRRRLVSTGVAVLICVGVVYLLVSLNRSTAVVYEELAAKEGKLEKFRTKLLEKDSLQRELLILQNSIKQAEVGLLTGKTPSLAAAEIQEIVTSIANAAGGQIRTIRVLQPEQLERQTYLAIPVEITMSSTMRELTRLLYRIDSSAKLLRVSKMEIKPFGGRGRRGSLVNLVTTLTIEGFVRRMDDPS